MAGAVTSICFTSEIDRLLHAHKQRTDSNAVYDLLVDPRLHFAIGLHPKTVAKLSDSALQHYIGKLRELATVFGDRFVALGEIGLDHTISEATWSRQARGLRRILEAFKDVIQDKTIVLHLRSRQHETLAHVYASRILRDLRDTGILAHDQHIQLHYYLDSEEIVQRWMQGFPNTFFSIPGAVENLVDARKVIKAIPRQQLLLETDAGAAAPMDQARARRRFASPTDVFRTAAAIAPHISLPRDAVIRLATKNALRAFRLVQ
jgi:Tat protein secretion system quality control protein TatD with DNase activity